MWSYRLVLLLVACAPKPDDSTGAANEHSTGQSTGGEPTTDPGPPTTSTGTTDSTGEPTTGHIPTSTCITAPQTHDACPDPCPLTVDVEIQCDDPSFGVSGLRVAASPDVVWLATASATDSFLHAAGLGETIRVELPAELDHGTILLATAPSGELHLAAEPIGVGDIVHLAEADGWQPSQVVPQRTLLDFEVDLAGTPHLWLADPDGYSEVLRVDDIWTEVLALAPDMALKPHFGLTRDGTTFGVGVRAVEGTYQLSSLVVDQAEDLGAPTPLYEYRVAPLATPVAPVDGPDIVFTHLHPDGLRVAWQAAPGLLVPEAAPLEPSCPIIITNEKNCPATCHDTAIGVEPGAFMVARTGDGRGWLAHLTTHLDHKVTYTPKVADIFGDYCDGAVHDDHDTGVLHLYELGFDGAQPTARLSLPIAAPALRDLDLFDNLYTGADRRPFDLRAFASSLAIGLRTRDSATGVLAVRLLRFETG